MKGVFITGATGNVGSRLVKEYLTDTDYQVHLLIRATTQAAAEERVARVLDFWDIDVRQYEARVHVYCGDTSTPALGLGPEQYASLCEQVQLIVHAASNLRLDLTPEQAREDILGGTKNVFALARSLKSLERFGYASTMEVMGRYPGLVTEEFLTHHDIDFLNNYEMAKFESEEYLRGEIENGYPLTILRIAMVVGETDSGKVLDFRTFYMMTEKFLIEPDAPVLPSGGPLDLIPTDFLSRAIVALMDYRDSDGRIFHLSQGLDDRVSFDDYLKIVKPIAEGELGRSLRLPILVWPGVHRLLFRMLAMVTFGKVKRAFTIRLVFLSFFGLNWKFDNKKTKETLRSIGIEWPRFHDYLPNLIRYYFAHRDENRLPF